MQCNVWIHGARLRLRLIQMITAAQNNALEVILSLAKKMWGVYFSPKLARRTQECIGHHVDFQNKIKKFSTDQTPNADQYPAHTTVANTVPVMYKKDVTKPCGRGNAIE